MANQITPFKNRVIHFDKPVRVYRNLNRPGVIYSLTQQGKVVAHCSHLTLTHCFCVINERLQRRVRQNKRREVHAFIEGLITEEEVTPQYTVHYNPFYHDLFFTRQKGALPHGINGGQFMTFGPDGTTVTGYY